MDLRIMKLVQDEFLKSKKYWINDAIEKGYTEEEAQEYFEDELEDFLTQSNKYKSTNDKNSNPFVDIFDFYTIKNR